MEIFHKRVIIFANFSGVCVVDPFKCDIGNIPEEPPGLAEAEH